jgi:hypothetical protein
MTAGDEAAPDADAPLPAPPCAQGFALKAGVGAIEVRQSWMLAAGEF